jgi:hypothetical protein
MILLAAIFWLQPRTMSYRGLDLMLNLAVPIAFATLAQMCVMTVNDLDLGIGPYVGFVACVAATHLVETPALGILMLAGGVVIYALVGRSTVRRSACPAIYGVETRFSTGCLTFSSSHPMMAPRHHRHFFSHEDEHDTADDGAGGVLRPRLSR